MEDTQSTTVWTSTKRKLTNSAPEYGKGEDARSDCDGNGNLQVLQVPGLLILPKPEGKKRVLVSDCPEYGRKRKDGVTDYLSSVEKVARLASPILT